MESYFYDYQGRMITQNQGKTGPYDMKTTAYAYNGFDNITSKTATLPNGNSQSISYTYNQLGLRTSMTDSTGTTTYAYTPFGELMSETKGTTVKNYAYDNMSNRTLFTLATDGVQNLNTSYTYDNLNRLASVTDSYNTVTYTYDNNSNLLQTVKADGSIENYTYNNANQLTQKVRTLNGAEKESYAYTYYLNGNIRTQNEVLPTVVNHTYTYDGMGRLTNETVSGDYTRNDTYTYDKRGNRLSLVSLDGTTTYTYNKNNQLLTLDNDTNSITYTYDDYGNRICKEGFIYGSWEWHDYEYDVFNRLETVDICGGSYVQNYTYDGDNIRQTIAESYSEPITDIYDGGNLVARKQGSDTHAYIYGLEQEFYISGNNFGIYTTNHRGDISKEIQLNTNTEKTRAYSAYGIPVVSGYSSVSPFGYAGEVRENTGLTYLRNRYYDEETGTFMTLDPIKDGMNWYSYCAGNPVMYVDPWGYAPGDHFETGDEAAEDWAKLYYEESYYVNFERVSIIYVARDSDGEIYYSYTEPRWSTEAIAPTPHGFDVGKSLNDIPENSAANSIIHSHTNGENFSSIDIDTAKKHNLHIYVVAPSKDKTVVIKKADKHEKFEVETVKKAVSTNKLSSSDKEKLKGDFKKYWKLHICTECAFGYECQKEKWPREDKNYKVY